MKCDNAAEFVSALCDREVIPQDAAEHIGVCPDCEARLHDYLAIGVELRRVASLEAAESAPSREWSKPQSRVSRWWQKGWGTMRIPRLAFASMFLIIMGLAASLLVVKVRAHSDGTVVLLTTTGPSGPLWDCPLSTLKKQDNCSWFGDVGSQHLAYKVGEVSRDGDRVLLAIRTRTYQHGENLSAFTLDTDPVTNVREVWFEPGESLKFDVPEVGTFRLTGQWMDHVPLLMGAQKQDFSPGPGELFFASPLLLKDKAVVGDLAGAISSLLSTDDPNQAVWMCLPGQGSFLISLLPMKGAVKANVNLSRISFEEGGHSWEFVTGTPVSREDHIWVLHQPDFKLSAFGNKETTLVGLQPLVQTEPSVWVPRNLPH